MQTIYCENKYRKNGQDRRCGRWLARLTDLQVDILKIDPEHEMFFRCPACKPEYRWKRVWWEDGLKMENCEKPDTDKPMDFDDVEIAQEVA